MYIQVLNTFLFKAHLFLEATYSSCSVASDDSKRYIKLPTADKCFKSDTTTVHSSTILVRSSSLQLNRL